MSPTEAPPGASERRAAPVAARRTSWIKVALFSLLPVFALLAVGEVGIRVWAYWFRTAYEHYNPKSGRLELVPNFHYVTPRGLEFRINSKGFLGPEFEERKPPGVYRIIAVGDSCTFGSGFWQQTYPAILGQLLNAGAGASRFEVINAGIEGYNSEFALERLRTELLAYQPDMVILYIGWNDLMKTDPRNAGATGRHSWLAQALDRSYLAKAYAKVLFYYIRPWLSKPRIGPDPAAAELSTFVPVRFRSNLEAAVTLLKAHGVVPVLVTLPTVVTGDMSQEDLQRAHVFFPYYPAGYGVEAFLQLHTAYSKVIRDVAAKEGITLVDLEVPLGGPARRPLFWDTMHPSLAGHRLIAEALAAAVQRVRPPGPKA